MPVAAAVMVTTQSPRPRTHWRRIARSRERSRPSVGTASWHPDRELIKSPVLLGRADEALYAAKTVGKDRVIAYEESLAGRDTLQAAIAEGLTRGEFQLYYQPLVNLNDGQIGGFEALMRWNPPGEGLLAPDPFIPVAETATLIWDLGRWALREAPANWRPGPVKA